jgi:hypothetical protein
MSALYPRFLFLGTIVGVFIEKLNFLGFNLNNMKSLERVKHWQEFLSPTSDTSTQDSKPIPREEILQAKGKLYQLHKQKMKQKLENDLVIMIPFAPVINPKHDNKENQEK